MKIYKMQLTLLTIGMLLLSSSSVSAGAWTQPKRNSYHRLAVNYYFAKNEFNADGNVHPMDNNGKYTDMNLNDYMEYGILDELTLIASLYYKMIKQEDDDYLYRTNGFGDADLGVRIRLHRSGIGIFSLQGIVKIPELYNQNSALPLGNGQYDYELRLLYGRSFWPVIPGYVNLEAGYRFREKTPSDEFRYLVEIGSELGANLYARAKLDALVSVDNADDRSNGSSNPANTLAYDLAKLDSILGYHVTPAIGLELGYTPTLWGKSTARGASWTVAVSYQPDK